MRIFILFLLTILLLSCKPSRYTTASYKSLAPTHEKIAILPFSMYYGGRTPDKPEEELKQMKNDESVMFQRSLYYQILDEAGPGEKDVHITIQDINETNRILSENGIELYAASKENLSEVSELLGVDGLVQIDLHKSFWLTNTEAVVVEVVNSTLGAALNIPTRLNRFNKTNEIRMFANVLDGSQKIPIWSYKKKRDTDLNCPPTEVVEGINHMISERFSYRYKM